MVTMTVLKTAILIEKMEELNKLKILFIFATIFTNNAFAETWVCTYNDGSMSSYVRKGKVMSFENSFLHDEIVFEDNNYIVTVNAANASAGVVDTNLFDKKHQTLLWSSSNNHWGRTSFQFNQCKVIE